MGDIFLIEDLDYGLEDFEIPTQCDYAHRGRVGIPTQESEKQLLKLYPPLRKQEDERVNTKCAISAAQPSLLFDFNRITNFEYNVVFLFPPSFK